MTRVSHKGRTPLSPHPGELTRRSLGATGRPALQPRVCKCCPTAPGRQVGARATSEVSAAAGGGLQGGGRKAGFWLLKKTLLKKSFCI